jgi:hypothetical protein
LFSKRLKSKSILFLLISVPTIGAVYPFTIIPQGVNAKVEGVGVQLLSNGTFGFVPAVAGVGEHSFTVNGNPADLKVTFISRRLPGLRQSRPESSLL